MSRAQELLACSQEAYDKNVCRIEEMEGMKSDKPEGGRQQRQDGDEHPSYTDVCGTGQQLPSDRASGVIEADPFVTSVRLQNQRKMNRAQRRYNIYENVIKTPSTNWNGRNLPEEIKPFDETFFQPSFCYGLRNMRIRRSKFGIKTFFYLQKSILNLLINLYYFRGKTLHSSDEGVRQWRTAKTFLPCGQYPSAYSNFKGP